jgi:hypothetical protein
MAALLGVKTTLIAAGLGGGLITFAALFLPGMRDIEREGRLGHSAELHESVPAQELERGYLPELVT